MFQTINILYLLYVNESGNKHNKLKI